MGKAKLKSGAAGLDYVRIFNLKKYEEGTILFASSTSADRYLDHSLGETPTFFYARPKYPEDFNWKVPTHPSYPSLYPDLHTGFFASANHITGSEVMLTPAGIVSHATFTIAQTGIDNVNAYTEVSIISLGPTQFKWNRVASTSSSYYSYYKGGVEYEYILGV